MSIRKRKCVPYSLFSTILPYMYSEASTQSFSTVSSSSLMLQPFITRLNAVVTANHEAIFVAPSQLAFCYY